MAITLSFYAKRLLSEEKAFLAELKGPVLLWEAAPQPGSASNGPSWEVTNGAGRGAVQPVEGEPLVFEVKKVKALHNAFAMGITVGRTENNDISIDHSSVSRFHAYLQQDVKTHAWKLVDAESSNGTFVGPMRLTANLAAELTDQSRLRFGAVEMRFLTASSFITYLREILED